MQANTEISQQMMTIIIDNLLANPVFLTGLRNRISSAQSTPSALPSQSQSQPQPQPQPQSQSQPPQQQQTTKVQHSSHINAQYSKIDTLIQQLSSLIQLLIKQKLQHELKQLITQNNAILQHIKNVLVDRNQINSNCNININSNNNSNGNNISGNEDNIDSFSDIRNIISQQKRKILFNDIDHQSSISMLGNTSNIQYDAALVQKFNELNKKVKAMEQKYQTNFKSLWNVLSMTQAAVFEHVRENKVIKIKKGTREDNGKLGENQENNEGRGGKGNNGKDKSIFSFWK